MINGGKREEGRAVPLRHIFDPENFYLRHGSVQHLVLTIVIATTERIIWKPAFLARDPSFPCLSRPPRSK